MKQPEKRLVSTTLRATWNHPAVKADFPNGQKALVSLVGVDEKDWARVIAELVSRGATVSDPYDLVDVEDAS